MSSGVAVQLTSGEAVVSRGVDFSLLKLQTIAQTIIGGTIITSVVVAVVVGVSVFATTVQYDFPRTNPDFATTFKVTPTRVFVLLNDNDPRGFNLTVTKVTNPQYGRVRIVDGSYVIYTPNKYFAGVDTFNYTAQNDKLESTSSVTVTVLNRAPEVIAQKYAINKNSKQNKANIFNFKNEAGLKVSDIDDDKLVVSAVTQPASGSTTFDDNFVYYTPNLNFNGIDQCNYTVSDGNDTASHIITFVVSNNAPEANPDEETVPKNTYVYINVLKNDRDINNDPLNITWCGNANRGSCQSPNGTFAEYTPDWTTATTTDSFEYTISDGSLSSSSFALLNLINNPPFARDISVDIGKNADFKDLEFGKLVNGKPVNYGDNDAADYVIVSVSQGPRFGQLDFQRNKLRSPQSNPLGSFFANDLKYVNFPDTIPEEYVMRYKPNPEFNSIDSIVYEVRDAAKVVATGTIRLIVGNLPPVAPAQSGTCARRRSTTVDVLVGVTDPNGDAVVLDTVTAISGVTRGTVGKDSNNPRLATYTAPQDGTVITDTFQYTVRDVQNNTADSKTATATVTITIFNQAPVATDDTISVPKGLTTNIAVLANDQDINGDALFINSIGTPEQGGVVSKVTVNGVDQVAYRARDVTYTDVFYYDIKDADPNSLVSTARAKVTVTVVNNPPVANNDQYSVFWNSTNTEFDVLANDEDANPGDKALLTIVDVTAPSQGGVATVTTTNKINYSPRAGFVGTETFTYKARDAYDNSVAATVTVAVTNRAPVANPDTFSKHHREQNVLIDVLANDSDPESNPLVLLSTNNSRAVVVTANGKQQIQYSSEPSFVGTETFTYVVSDYNLQSIGTVTVTVTNTAPVANPDTTENIHWSSTTPRTISVLSNDVDSNNDPLTLVRFTTPQGFRGSVAQSGSNLVYTPPGSGFKGTQQFTYVISDGAAEATGTVTIEIVNPTTPSTPAQSATAHWRTQSGVGAGTTLTLMTATDGDGDTQTLTFTQPPQQTNVVRADSTTTSVVYQRSNWKGTDTFSYSVSDGLDSASGQVTVTITNAVPVAPSITVNFPAALLQTGLVVSPLASCSDADAADESQLSVTSFVYTGSSGSLTPNGNTFTFVPSQAFINNGGGNVEVTYTITDGLDSASGVITIAVPRIDRNAFNVIETMVWNTVNKVISPFSNTINPISVQPTNGQATLNNNQITYRPNNGFLGNDFFETTYHNNSVTNNRLIVYITVTNTLPAVPSPTYNLHWRSLLNPGVLLNVLSGSTDADGDTITLTGNTAGARGSTAIQSGQIRYIASQAFLTPNTDVFTFTARDGIQSVTRSATIVPTNTIKPSAPTRSGSVHWRTGTVTVTVLTATTDGNGDTLSFSVPNTPAFVSTAATTLTYTRNNFVGTHSFPYTVSDGIESASGSISIEFTNTAPVANPDTFSIYWRQATQLSFNPLTNDNDANSDPLTITTASVTSGAGTVNVDTVNNRILFRPAGNSLASSVVTYTITDGQATATSTITFTMTNTAPVATQVTGTVKRTATIQLQAACTDANNDPLTFSLVSNPTRGTFSMNSQGLGTYTPVNPVLTCSNNLCTATDTFTFRCSDTVSSNDNNFVVTITNIPPVAVNDAFTTARNRATPPTVTLTVLNNDSDADGDAISLTTQFSANQGGVVTRSQDARTLSYTPAASFAGTEQVTYQITDGSEFATAIATITVGNSAPTCTNFARTLAKGQSLKIYPLTDGNCQDVNVDPLTYTVATQPTKGSVSLGSDAGGSFLTYTPAATRSGSDSVVVTVSDGSLTTSLTITLTINNRAPNAPADKTFTFSKFASARTYTLSPLTGTSDPDGDALSLTAITNTQSCWSAAGSLTRNGNTVTYVASASWAGTCEFTYTIRDNDVDNPLTNTGRFIVVSENADPVVVSDFFSTDQNTVFTTSTSVLIANDWDANNDTITFDGLMCGQSGYTCLKTPTLSGSTITVPADQTCQQVQFFYRIRTNDGRTTVGSFFVKYINCRCKNPIDLIFLLDGSGSISDANWIVMKDFVNQIVDRLEISSTGVRVGVTQFASSDRLSSSSPRGFNFMSSSVQNVKNAITALTQYKGGTATLRGLDGAVSLGRTGSGARSDVAKAIVVVTDGAPNWPCSCSACSSYYGSANQNRCTRAAWPGQTCSNCAWDDVSWCMPCADPRERAAEINAFRNPTWKIVGVGIGGDLSPHGELMVKDLAFEPTAYFRIGWDNAGSIAGKIIDETCY